MVVAVGANSTCTMGLVEKCVQTEWRSVMKKLWKWLDGKKSYIGLLLMAGSKFCGEFESIVYIVGTAIAGVGGADKVRKLNKNRRS